MKIKISDIKDKMNSVLGAKGYKADEIDYLIETYLGGELRGHIDHGLASFPGFVNKSQPGLDNVVVLKETNSTFVIDAQSNMSGLIGKRAADEAIKRAKSEIVGVSIIKNMDSWPTPGTIAKYIADQGLVAFVTNSGGGTAIAPPGGYDSVVGTNPIAYGIPTSGSSLVVDMATAKRAWGQVRMANKYGTDLPADTFYDASGNVTVDPKEAESVMSFGGYKGFALALFIEVLCGSMVGMDMMVESKAGSSFGQRMPVRGAFIMVVDPSQITSLPEFKQDNTELISKIKSTRALPGEEIRVPGDNASLLQDTQIKNGSVEINDALWAEIGNL